MRVEQGAIVALRLFDVAYSIDLSRAESIVRTLGGGMGASRTQISAPRSKAIAFDVPPLQLTLPTIELKVGGRIYGVTPGARIYDFGVVTLSLRLAADGVEWEDYVERANRFDAALEAPAGDPTWRSLLDTLRRDLAPALTRASDSVTQEDYLLAVVQRWSEPMDASALQACIDLEPLLSGEQRPLSSGARHDLLRHRFSYFQDDLVVLTWDRAFVCEPRGDTDVIDVLEVANAQLLEMRYYDALLDDELPRMYDLVEETRRRWLMRGPRRFANLARSLHSIVAEVTEVTEKVDNALQVTEDVYLARVYSAALDQLRVPLMSAAVDRKLAIIRDTYTALYDEQISSRAQVMELAIVVLIVIELVLALMRP